MNQEIIYKGSLDTRNYSFESYGLTEQQAYKALKRTWNAWRRVSGATLTWKELYEGGDAYVMPYEIGKGYMDREIFK